MQVGCKLVDHQQLSQPSHPLTEYKVGVFKKYFKVVFCIQTVHLKFIIAKPVCVYTAGSKSRNLTCKMKYSYCVIRETREEMDTRKNAST